MKKAKTTSKTKTMKPMPKIMVPPKTKMSKGGMTKKGKC